MKSVSLWLAVVASLQSAALLAQAAQAPPAFPRPATIRVADNAVAARVGDCGDWLRRLGSLPNNYKWAETKQPPTPPAKDEFETTAQYGARLAVFASEAEPIWINIAFPVNRNALTYDADSGVMSVRYTGNAAGLDATFTEGTSYSGRTAFGETTTVIPQNLRTSGARFAPSDVVLPNNLQLRLSPAAARRLKEEGIVHVLGVVQRTTISGGFGRAMVTPTTEITDGHREIRIAPVCVAAMVGGTPVPQWQYFGVPEAIAVPAAFAPPKPQKGTIARAMESYPSRAAREGRQGRVGVRLNVGVDGRVTSCQVTSSSGHADLDEAACTNLGRYARFDPASRYGTPVSGQYDTSLTYRLN